MLSKGERFQNYHIEEILQHESMVDTYLVSDETQKKYILKCLKKDFAKDTTLSKTFVSQYVAQKKRVHDHLVSIHKVLRKENAVLIDYVEGQTLESYLEEGGKIEPLSSLKVMAQILDALNILHQKRVPHLEINSRNVMIEVLGDGRLRATLMDHGILHRVRSKKVPMSKHIWAYMSPEQITNPSSAKFRSDIYTAGALLFEMMSGQKMIMAENEEDTRTAIRQGKRPALKEAAPNVATSISLVIEQALQTNPVSRYPTIKAFNDALVRAVGQPLLEDLGGRQSSALDDMFFEPEEVKKKSEEEDSSEVYMRTSTASQKASKSSSGNKGRGGSSGDTDRIDPSPRAEADQGARAQGSPPPPPRDSASSEASSEQPQGEERGQGPSAERGTDAVHAIVESESPIAAEVLEHEIKYSIDGEVITLTHAAEDWAEVHVHAKHSPFRNKRWLLLAMLAGIMLGAFLYYKAQTRVLFIDLEGTPQWGQVQAFWNQAPLKRSDSNIEMSDVEQGEHTLYVKGGVYRGDQCTRCCWERSFQVNVPMGVTSLFQKYSLKGEQGFPACPTVEAGYKFALIPKGEFMMGLDISAPDREEDERLHRVEVSQEFMMGESEVTQELYQLVMAANPSKLKKPEKPVDSVSWLDAVQFCNRLSILEGLKPCYKLDRSYVHWPAGITCDGYRLPTEAEWEYAARAEKNTAYSLGDDPEQMWYSKNSRGSQDVKKKGSNTWGLFDMSGNVAEWVWDYYGDYITRDFRDPKGPIEGKYRVFRGGDWRHLAIMSRVYNREEAHPERRSGYIGFRIVQRRAQEP